ncbi:MAG: hypothetical protein H6722_19090 [Sandaracinus sp.]|nr:hypothetical protein [Sandaracinus sp.]MCB9614550.1 hypothetical protein [Sandaracinus sp.]MCB9620659.1 hypothetical protein [Sandaracinus sp.]MCB9622956.1 hypothetical protein [Sandaracinus sp.]
MRRASFERRLVRLAWASAVLLASNTASVGAQGLVESSDEVALEPDDADASRVEASTGPHRAFVIFDPDWMPIVTLGYQFQRLDWTTDYRVVDEPNLNGVSANLLVPIFATGTPDAPTRLAFGVGVDVDFAMRTIENVRVPGVRHYDPRPDAEPPRATLRHRAVQVAAQLGAIVRAAPNGRGFLGSLVWMPGVRLTQFGYEGAYSYPVPNAQRERSARRGRVTLGYVHDHVYGAFFVGASRWAHQKERYLVPTERVFELGLQVGAGW